MITVKIHFENKAYTAILIKSPEGGFSAYIKEIPGANTQGDTIQEAEENLKDALRLVLDVNQSLKV